MTSRRKLAPLSGVVMAGGRSARFGRDKAAINIAGQTLLDRTVRLLAEVVDSVYVSINPEQADDALRNQYALLIDDQKDSGPMAGLLAAHRRAPEHAWFALACDMPLLDLATLRELVGQRDAARAATVFSSPVDGGPEPLCAIYEPDTLARFRREVQAGRSLIPREELGQADICRVTPRNPAAMSNINRPEDLAELEPVLIKKR